MDTKRFTNNELSSFCGQLALILRSGISATEGLTVMLDDTTDNTERAFYSRFWKNRMRPAAFIRRWHARTCSRPICCRW